MTSTTQRMADKNPSKRQRKGRALNTADVFRDALKVKRLRKTETVMDAAPGVNAAPGNGELMPDHEWAALIHTFEHEAEAHASSDVEDELWKRLSSTRWLKDNVPDETGPV